MTRPGLQCGRSHAARRLAWMAALAGALGCHGRASRESVSPPPLAVEVSGCAAIVREDVCERAEPADKEGLRIWIAGAAADAMEVDVDGVPVAPFARVSVGEGTRVTLAVPAGDVRLHLRAAGRSATIHVVPATRAEAIDRARALRRAGDLGAADALLDASWASLGERDRARATGMRARIALARGDIVAAAPLFHDAIDRDRRLDDWSEAVQDGCALAFAMTMRHRFAEARAALDALTDLLPHDAEGRAAAPYYRALLASETGDARELVAQASLSEVLSARLGLEAQRRDAESLQALRLADSWPAGEALRRLRALAESARVEPSPCDEGNLLIDIAWVELSGRDHDAISDARGALARASEIFDSTCKSSRQLAYAQIDLALADVREGAPDDAAAAATRARQAMPRLDAEAALDALDVDARVLLTRGAVKGAVAAFERERVAAVAALSLQSEWRALVGRGEAESHAGASDAAVRSFETAEELLGEGIVRVPMNEARSRFLGAHDASARHLVSTLVALGRATDASLAARRARARAIETLTFRDKVARLGPAERTAWESALERYRIDHERLAQAAEDDWQRSEATLAGARNDQRTEEQKLRAEFDRAVAAIDDPGAGGRDATWSPPREDGVVDLVFYPGDADWLALATGHEGTVAARISERAVLEASKLDALSSAADLARTAELLLAPLAASIRAARTLRVLPYGPLASLDFHALPFDGAPLLARANVVYPVDVADVSDDPRLSRPVRRALVVADPLENLRHGREDGARVADALRALGDVEVLGGPDAQLAAFTAALGRADALHFAGHAVYDADDAAGSALLLAGGARWTAGDALMLTRAPRWVFLSACESAKTTSEAIPAAVGIAQGFVLAGSETVVASTRVVDDALASELTARAYASGNAGAFELAARVRAAELAILAEGPSRDWAAFRTITR